MQPQVSQDLLGRGPLQDGRDDLQACWEADGHERLLVAVRVSSGRRPRVDVRRGRAPRTQIVFIGSRGGVDGTRIEAELAG
jgi:hypothetical protein